MIKLGTQNISALRLGGQEIKKAYLGETLVLGAEKKPSRLPEGYTEVEYVQSDGASWFDLGVKPSSNTEIDMVVETLEAGVSTSTKYFVISYLQQGSGTSVVRYYFDISWSVNGAGGRLGGYAGTTRTPAVAVNNNAPRKMSLNIFAKGKTFSEDGHSVSAGTNNTFPATTMPNIKILGNSTKNGLKANLYAFDRFDGSSLTLQNKLIPCISPSGAVGLYDLVGAKFYGNAGTGTLTAGPAV